MAAHAFWKGYLKLSLVTCPIALIPARTENERVRFHTLNRATGNRVESRYVVEGGDEAVPDDERVLGYERAANDYVTLEDEELASVALESTRTIDIDMFVPNDSIGWVWYDQPHYLIPDDPVGQEAYCVIRDAMESTSRVAVSRLVLYRRERAVMLEPRGRGMVLWTLRFGNEVRDENNYFADIAATKTDRKLMELVSALFEQRSTAWRRDLVHDPVQERLLEIIESKRKGRKPVVKRAAEPERPTNVVNIVDALRNSIAAERKRRK